MTDKTDAGQTIAKLLTILAALAGGGTVTTNTRPEGVEVIAILRDNWPGSPVVVRFATENGTETVHLDDFEIVES